MSNAPTTWKLTLSYDGAPFHGWQVQPNQLTVQGTLAAAIQRVTGQTVLPQGSGRTDSGVHAHGQVASFTLTVPIPAPNLLRALNSALPPTIRILAATPVDAAFHARHAALRKTYEYRLFEGNTAPATERICSPFLAPFVWDCRWQLQLEPMQAAAALLLGTHDFTSFAASDPDLTLRSRSDAATGAPNPVKTLFHSNWTRQNDELRYRITGSGFLHHMVRNLVGTMVDVGRGALQPADIPRILARRDRAAAGPTAPAQGLYLMHVEYAEPGEARP